MIIVNNIRNALLFFYKNITILAIITVLAFLAQEYSLYHKHIQAKKAFRLYEQMLMSYKKKDFISVMYHANSINKKHKNTIYSNISQLFLAKNAFTSYKYKKTSRYLKNIKYNKCNPILQNAINERLIKTYIMRKKWKKALILLAFYDKGERNSIYQEMKGDVYLSLNEIKKAKIMYVRAKQNSTDKINNYFLDIKIKYLSIITLQDMA